MAPLKPTAVVGAEKYELKNATEPMLLAPTITASPVMKRSALVPKTVGFIEEYSTLPGHLIIVEGLNPAPTATIWEKSTVAFNITEQNSTITQTIQVTVVPDPIIVTAIRTFKPPHHTHRPWHPNSNTTSNATHNDDNPGADVLKIFGIGFAVFFCICAIIVIRGKLNQVQKDKEAAEREERARALLQATTAQRLLPRDESGNDRRTPAVIWAQEVGIIMGRPIGSRDQLVISNAPTTLRDGYVPRGPTARREPKANRLSRISSTGYEIPWERDVYAEIMRETSGSPGPNAN